jgi:eukaryotic-like serine/threonine-protein kinase
MPLIGGARIGPYEILAPLGSGGMGEVYRARDMRLDRVVAIKVLSAQLVGDPAFRERFEREARSAAALNHPNICTLFDVGPNYLFMELVEGETLAEVLRRGPLPMEQALGYGAQIAGAMATAHAHGLVHRDLKPANVMIAENGVKVLDFGLAKRSRLADEEALTAPLTVPEGGTGAGHIVGTLGYMSPEQAEGKHVDARSDVFALGVLLYEMLCGRRPFRGDTTLSTLASILQAAPEPPRHLRGEIPEKVERIVLRCLEKKPEARYPSMQDVLRELAPYQIAKTKRFVLRRPAVVAIVLTILAGASAIGIRSYISASRVRWVEAVAVPELARSVAASRRFSALKLYREAEGYAPASRALQAFAEGLRAPSLAIQTTPLGAEIYVSDYLDARDDDGSHWDLLGVSPLVTERIPYLGYYRVRAVKAGFETVEHTFDPVDLGLGPSAGRLELPLQTKESVPTGMVWVGSVAEGVQVGFTLVTPTALPAFWLDKYEVTNRKFKEFTDAGGYQKREYWKEPFVKAGKVLSWEQAMAGFRDATGRPGPATWQLGTYPEGTADLPVGGVSWYEAAAYAHFAKKSLPTAYHWFHAAGVGFSSDIIQLSNFGGRGPEAVGKNRGLSRFGTFDMAGNLKEWSASAAGSQRLILGGGWNEASYMFSATDAHDPFERQATFGFRCARFVDPPPDALLRPVTQWAPIDRDHDEPVTDEAFRIYSALHAYDKSDLNARIESVDGSRPYQRRETVSFLAAYGDERVLAHLFLPTNAAPPYQVVLFVPSGNMLQFRSIASLPDPFEFLVRSGRAVMVTAFKGALERGPSPLYVGPNQNRDRLLYWSKDLRRSLDYLETRPDIDSGKAASYGISYGATISSTLIATEPRVKTAVLVSGGVLRPLVPEVDPLNYARRVTIPILMLNGRDDFVLPLKTSQLPLFRAFGTPEKDKRHVLYDGGHVNLNARMDLIGEILNWLDHYLGAVTTKP